MTTHKPYKVKDVARIARVSVRTLHHYDEIGLLTPDRSAKGYRLYTEQDLLRLQQILIGRLFGMALEDIKRLLDDPNFDYAASLTRQRADLVTRLSETNRMIASIDAALDALTKKDMAMNTDFKAIFDGFDPADYEDEAAAKWGNTDAYTESQRRTKKYGDTEWRAIKEEADAIWKDGAAALKAGHAPDSAEGFALAERHRQHIVRWFYALDPSTHANLADMWEADDRFATTIDKHGTGLTQWFADAIRNAAASA